MDTNQAEEQYSSEEGKYWESEWPSEETEEHTEDIDYANAKGKGKGKGSQLCYNCGKPGHRLSNAQNRKGRKDGEKEVRHQMEKEKERCRYWTCGTQSKQAKERAEEKEKDSKAIAKGVENMGIRQKSAEPSCQQEKWKKKGSQKSTGLA